MQAVSHGSPSGSTSIALSHHCSKLAVINLSILKVTYKLTSSSSVMVIDKWGDGKKERNVLKKPTLF
jgi:hypothetical protein